MLCRVGRAPSPWVPSGHGLWPARRWPDEDFRCGPGGPPRGTAQGTASLSRSRRDYLSEVDTPLHANEREFAFAFRWVST